MAQPPTHPELLDWLASEFMAKRWQMKQLHKLLVMSHTYRQTSAVNPEGQARDAGNTLLWRMPMRRMDAEMVRDAILSVSGKLDRRMYGPGYALFKISHDERGDLRTARGTGAGNLAAEHLSNPTAPPIGMNCSPNSIAPRLPSERLDVM